MKIIGFIPARLDSKGVPLKNFRPLLGLSQVSRTSMAAGAMRTYLSTDHPDALWHMPKDCIWRRAPELATSTATVADVLKSHLDQIVATEATGVMVLYPNYPLRDGSDLAWITHEWRKDPTRGLVGIVASKEPAHLLVNVAHTLAGTVVPIQEHAWQQPNRQQHGPTYRLCLFACVVPVAQIKDLPGQPVAPGSRAIEIPEHKALEIDTWNDWHEAERILRARA